MSARRPTIACLLPARNAERHLPDWLESVSRFADWVVALDDGSVDGTGELLRGHPLVAATLVNPPRSTHLGWHDGRNRNRLLAAAADLRPDWIFSLDADERVDVSDADALLRFVATEALPGCAYGFKVYRMLGGERYDPEFEWVFRLFPFREGQHFRNRRVDLVPVPTAIPPRAWVLTTIRIQHLGDDGGEGRRRRLSKYAEADPEGTYAGYYGNLKPLSPGPYPRWRARDPAEPLLLAAAEPVAGPVTAEVVCLLRTRNAADRLPAWVESAARFADAVVALDDGSSDGTVEALRSHPLVASLLTSDGGRSLNRLLAEAAKLSPRWVISLDADEVIPLEDAVALRRFLRDEARPGYAYSFPVYRMVGDGARYDRLDCWAARLFAFEPGQALPDDPREDAVPVTIPRERWRPTTIRVQRLRDGGAEPGPGRRWMPRPLGLAGTGTWAASDGLEGVEAAALDLDGPLLSLVLVVGPGEEREAAAQLGRLREGAGPEIEAVAVTRDRYAGDVLRRMPGIRVVEADPDLAEGALRNEALRVAAGDYATFRTVGDEIRVDDLLELLAVHEAGNGLVCVRVVRTGDSPAGEADFALRCAEAEGGSTPGGDVRYVSFAREPLLAAGGFDPRLEESLEAVAGRVLLARGLAAGVAPTLLYPAHEARRPAELIRLRFELGRGLARARLAPGLRLLDDAAAARQRLATSVRGQDSVAAGLVALSVAATWAGAARERLSRRRAPRPRTGPA